MTCFKNPNGLTGFVSHTLASLLTLIALNAFGGGYYGMSGADSIPREWIHGTPFHSYFMPGLLLFTGVGGSALVAAVAVWRKNRKARLAVMIAGIVLSTWILAQLAIIGYVSWLQPIVAAAAVIILLLGRLLPD